MSARDTAAEYLSRSWAPIPIPWRGKKPGYGGWPHLRVTPETLGAHFNGVRQNIGVLLGEPSGWLVDVDLDCPEALVVAKFLLPDTGCIFGRSGNPDSHHLFVPKVATKKFVEPRRPDGNEGAMLVELRSTGCHTLFPGSAHPTGQLIEWTCDNGPAEIEGARLTRIVGLVASAALVARYWPAHARHEASLALSGALRRSGWSLEQTEIFVKAVVEAAGDEEVTDRIRAARDTYTKETPTTGWTRLAELLGEPVIDRLRDWLGVRREARQEPPIGEEPPPRGNGADFTRNEPPGKTDAVPDKRIFHDTDFANARRLAKLHGADLRFTPERGWIAWNRTRWVPDDQGLAMELAKDAAKSVFDEIRDADEAAQGELFKWARRSQSIERARAMLALTQSEPGIPAHWTDFDADPWALHFVNGALNLELPRHA